MNASLVFGFAATSVIGGWLTWREVRNQLTSWRTHLRLDAMADRRRWAPPLVGKVRDRLLAARRSRAIDSGLAAWLDAAARSARAGASLRHALLEGAASLGGAPTGVHLIPFADALRGGETLGRALDGLDTDSTAARRLVGRALRLAAATGGPSASMLDAVAATLHERSGVAREVRALATQARASAAVMVAAPIVFSLGAMAADPGVGEFLTSTAGVLCIGLGLCLDAVGAAWMSRLVRVPS